MRDLRPGLPCQDKSAFHQIDLRNTPGRRFIEAVGGAQLGIPELRIVCTFGPGSLHIADKTIRAFGCPFVGLFASESPIFTLCPLDRPRASDRTMITEVDVAQLID
jgi:hypothetical protein